MVPRLTLGCKPTQVVAERELKNASESLHTEQKNWIEGMKVISVALAEEVQGGEQRNKWSDKVTATVPESEPPAPSAPDPREVPVEPDPNPKRRLLMKSALSTASGVDSEGRGGQSQMMKQVCKLKTRRKWALMKAQRCQEHRQQTPGEALL